MRRHQEDALFSIVSVTLNPGETDLRATVASVMGQECGDWELLVKDGGSTDGSVECLPQDGRIRVVGEKDSGIFEAMNQALKRVRGRYVCFLNAGDMFYDERALGAVAEVARARPEAEFLYGDTHKPQSRLGFERYPGRLSRFYLFTHMICHQAWFVKRSYYESAEAYETDLPCGADYRFLLRMMLRDRVEAVRVPAVVVTYKGGGVSQMAEHRATAERWMDELRREYYGRGERVCYKGIWAVRNGVKRAVYDRFLWRIVRMMGKKRN